MLPFSAIYAQLQPIGQLVLGLRSGTEASDGERHK